MTNLLTIPMIKERLVYNAATGQFTWRNGRRANKSAGYAESRGQIRIKICGRLYFAHRLAWLYSYGEWPTQEVDHINGDPSDNRLENLRVVGRKDNGRNQRRYRTNQSGITGVNWIASKRKWKSIIKHNGQSYFLGYFSDVEKAKAARKTAERMFGFHPNHGSDR